MFAREGVCTAVTRGHAQWCLCGGYFDLGWHSTLEVTGVLGQQLKTRGLLVRDFSLKTGTFSEKTKKGGSNGES